MISLRTVFRGRYLCLFQVIELSDLTAAGITCEIFYYHLFSMTIRHIFPRQHIRIGRGNTGSYRHFTPPARATLEHT